MLLAPGQQNLEEWKQSLNSYQRSKRTKRPFGKVPPPVQRNLKVEVAEKQMRFNPVLQSFRDEREMSRTIQHEQIQKAKQQIKHLHNNYKYNVEYDIINFAPAISLPPRFKSLSLPPDTRKKEYKDPTYYQFNIIDGSNYDQHYLNNRRLKQEKHHQRRINPQYQPYNIISGSYPEPTHQNSYLDTSIDNQSLNQSTITQQYDPIYGRYLNPEDEEKYQQSEQHYQSANTKLPPSYINRESLILDQAVPPSEIIRNLDAKKEKAKERYKLRYQVQDQHQTRGRFQAELKQMMTKNRVHEGRIEQEKARQFNILSSKMYEQNRAQRLFGKQVTGRVYDLRPYAKNQTNRSLIKHSGFQKVQQQ